MLTVAHSSRLSRLDMGKACRLVRQAPQLLTGMGHISNSEKRGWLGVVGLMLFCVSMWQSTFWVRMASIA